MSFSVLMVCTGNIFRSPAAQFLMARDLGNAPGVQVSSAGTAAVLGHAVAWPMVELLEGVGIDPRSHRARHLTSALVRESDLVIGMSRAHRARAISLWPDAYRRCFTLNELARLARGVTQDELDRATAEPGLDARFAALAELAATRQTAGSEADDIHDPVGAPPDVVQSVFDEITESVDTIARVVRGRRRRPNDATGR